MASSSIAVVLPAPLGPSRPTSAPGRNLEVKRVEGADAAVVAPEPRGVDRRRPRSRTLRLGGEVAVDVRVGAGVLVQRLVDDAR